MRPRMRIRLVAALAAATLAAPSLLRAQDHVNVTIVAPTLGSFPRLVAGSFDVVNQDQLVSQVSTSGTSQSMKATGANEPPRVQMTLPWGGEVAQLLAAMASTTVPSAIDHIRCDFVHAGSSQPYYTVVIDQPLITRIDLVYDSTTATAAEQISISAPQVEFMDGSTTSTATTSGQAATASRTLLHPMAAPKLRVVGTPMMLRQLTTMAASASAGAPVAGFASFAAGTGNSSSHFAAEGTFPAWATGAMANVEALTVSFERPVAIYRQTLPGGVTQATPRAAAMKSVVATFTKPVGSLSNDLQGAVSGMKRVTTTFELADAPGRLAYSFQFTNGYISSDHTSLNNGHATEQVTVTSGNGVVVTNLRSNVSAHVQ